jgi:hypothetical protein
MACQVSVVMSRPRDGVPPMGDIKVKSWEKVTIDRQVSISPRISAVLLKSDLCSSATNRGSVADAGCLGEESLVDGMLAWSGIQGSKWNVVVVGPLVADPWR